MLKKAHISDIKMRTDSWNYRDEWKKARLGKITSSKASLICGERGLGEGGTSYLYNLVGEELSGESSEPDLDTDATRWGLKYESEAIDKFGVLKKISFVVVQQLISPPGSRFGSTPDFLIIVRESTDGTEYHVETGECKCFPSFRAYIGMALCNTPQDVKAEDRKVYFQVLHQMIMCGSVKGYLVCYHPLMRAGNLNVVEFDALQSMEVKGGKIYPIHDDMKMMRERMNIAEEKFYEIRDKMIRKGFF